MKVYLASTFKTKHEMSQFAYLLEDFDLCRVVSRWHERKERVGDLAAAQQDLEDIRACDTLVLFTEPASTTGGKHFETGYAYSLNKDIILVGPPTNVFHYLPEIERVPDWDTLKVLLAGRTTKANSASTLSQPAPYSS